MGDAIYDDAGKVVRAGFYSRIGGRGYCVFPFESGGGTYLAGFDFVSYRAYMHGKALWVLLIMVLVPLVSLIVYPFLFYTSLGVPLAGLLEGVRSVDRGDLAVRVPLLFKDEIGHISHMFNRMVDTLREKNRALDDYAANLERKVEERTHELEKEREELALKNNIIQNDLHLARKIQQGLVPVSSPLPCISFLYKPMEQVGGDFYDFIRFRDRHKTGIFICDVSGHGVSAAFITTMIKTAILQSGERKENPAELLTYINDLLCGQTAGNFITALYCIWFPDERRVLYANAGHPQPYLVSDSGVSRLPKGTVRQWRFMQILCWLNTANNIRILKHQYLRRRKFCCTPTG
jgi:HAMP domain-containing protein